MGLRSAIIYGVALKISERPKLFYLQFIHLAEGVDSCIIKERKSLEECNKTICEGQGFLAYAFDSRVIIHHCLTQVLNDRLPQVENAVHDCDTVLCDYANDR